MLYGVFIATRVPGQSECWTRVGPRFVKVQTALRRALQIDPGLRGKAEIRNLQTDRAVWIAGVWLSGTVATLNPVQRDVIHASLQAGRDAVAGRVDEPGAARTAWRVVKAGQSALAFA